jgi:hypothetical protein
MRRLRCFARARESGYGGGMWNVHDEREGRGAEDEDSGEGRGSVGGDSGIGRETLEGRSEDGVVEVLESE